MNIEEVQKRMINTRAFNGVSFDPEKRISRFTSDFESDCEEIKRRCDEFGVEAERFLQKYFNLAMSYLNAESSCLSWTITGRGNFPVARNQKRMELAHNHLERYEHFIEHLEKTLRRITRTKESQTEKAEKWTNKIEILKARQMMMKSYNRLVKKDESAAAALLDDWGKNEVAANNSVFGVKLFPSFQMRNNLANIKRLEGQAKQVERLQSVEIQDFEFEGGAVKYDNEEIRFNIFFNTKPNEETRGKLKRNGFKWSPSRGAWTRGAKTISLNYIKEILTAVRSNK